MCSRAEERRRAKSPPRAAEASEAGRATELPAQSSSCKAGKAYNRCHDGTVEKEAAGLRDCHGRLRLGD